MQTKYAIWDIDNCIADDKWRAPLVEFDKTGNDRYDAYNRQMMGDPAFHLAEFRFMCRFTTPVFFTGRVAKWQTYTTAWLRDKGFIAVEAPTIYMRDNDDPCIPAELKQKMLTRLISRVGKDRIVAAFDDVPAVVQMYRDNGINATLLHINDDFSGIYQPRDLETVSVTNA